MRILLTGGTGLIGTGLRRVLEDRGDTVVVVSRKAGQGTVGWDDVDAEVARAEAVVHLAGEPVAAGRWTPARMERIRSSRVDTTARLARAVAGASRRPHVLVSASAVGIYGMRHDDATCDEETPPGSDVLARLCVEWEAAADPARAAGVRVVHPRIGIVLGHGGAYAKMAIPYRFFAGGPVGDGRQWLSWIHVKDVVRALLFVLDDEALAGPFNFVAPAPATMNEMARAIGRALGRPSLLRVPAFALRLAMGDALAEALLSGQRVSCRRLERAGFAFDFPSLDGALAALR